MRGGASAGGGGWGVLEPMAGAASSSYYCTAAYEGRWDFGPCLSRGVPQCTEWWCWLVRQQVVRSAGAGSQRHVADSHLPAVRMVWFAWGC